MICLPAGGYRSRCGYFAREKVGLPPDAHSVRFDKNMIYIRPGQKDEYRVLDFINERSTFKFLSQKPLNIVSV